MKASHLLLPTVGAVLAAGMIPWTVTAEIPNRSPQQMLSSATHAFTGVVQQTYARSERKGNYEFTYGLVEMSATLVDKGDDIVAGDRVYVRYWRKKWVGRGNPDPGHDGHRSVPKKSATVEVYVKGDRKLGFDALSPNGFFRVVQAEASKPKRGP